MFLDIDFFTFERPNKITYYKILSFYKCLVKQNVSLNEAKPNYWGLNVCQ